MSRKNYTETEKSMLLGLIQKYISIIECKETNAVSVCRKKVTWDKIAREFNFMDPETPRSAKQLHTAYLNFKRVSRQTSKTENNGISVIGSGAPRPVFTEVDVQMQAIIDREESTLANNCSDTENSITIKLEEYNGSSDSIDFDNNEVGSMDEVDEFEDEVNSEDIDSMEDVGNSEDKDIIEDRCSYGHQSSLDKYVDFVNLSGDFKSQALHQKKTLKYNGIPKHIKCNTKQYYRKKFESAVVEKKTKILEYKYALNRLRISNLELKMKKIEYSNLLRST